MCLKRWVKKYLVYYVMLSSIGVAWWSLFMVASFSFLSTNPTLEWIYPRMGIRFERCIVPSKIGEAPLYVKKCRSMPILFPRLKAKPRITVNPVLLLQARHDVLHEFEHGKFGILVRAVTVRSPIGHRKLGNH
jgi:hypothetical protein